MLFLAEGYLLHASIIKHTSFKTCSAYIPGITVARCKSRAYRKQPILPSPSKHEYFVGPLENGIYMRDYNITSIHIQYPYDKSFIHN